MFSFGAPATSTPAQPQGATSAFSFGAPKPAGTPGQQTGIGFGTNTQTTGFGTNTQQMQGFGANTQQNPGFGANTQQNPGFGANTQQNPGFGANTQQNPGFGGITQQTQGFGANPQQNPGFGAGGQTQAPAFGQPPTSAAPAFGVGGGSSFNFGAPTSSAPTGAAPGSSFGFGAQSTAASTANTGQIPTLNFGASAVTSTAATGSVSTLGNLALCGGNYSLNKPATTTTSASLNFGTTTTTTLGGQPGGGGLFGKPLATTTAAATAPTPFLGLGGVDNSFNKPKAGDSNQDNIKVKETQVPDEIAKTVDSLKTHIKIQKTLSSDIGRTSTSKLTNVSGEIMNLQWALQEISNSVEANYNQIKLLRKETSKTIQSVEMAQRTQDTPVGLQFENNAPFQFFQNLVAKYEHDLINFREQIALTERHMQSLTHPQNVAPEDLKRGFRQINESFISLAGRLNEVHQKVESQKDQYLNLRKYRLRDNSNVFAQLDNPAAKVDTSRITAGPTPFSNITAISNFGKSFSNSSASKGTTTQTGN